ncbi:hypothetical protein RHMOL_Rhmol05G0013000 [Rhododendron molle]|uniref:Uncharacterized protein n=1 Tax=Rhododendron molle TaxID=49168 RepID=A0ACC0NJ79_RHOML|nr:hypothetical protein RHMOL_Rhmol05G0013000 [Rhododendron molle]
MKASMLLLGKEKELKRNVCGGGRVCGGLGGGGELPLLIDDLNLICGGGGVCGGSGGGARASSSGDEAVLFAAAASVFSV